MRARAWHYPLALSVLALVLMFLAFLPLTVIMTTSPEERRLAPHGLGGFFLVFLGLLVLRYAAYLWFGALHHGEDEAAGDDAFLPPVTILVPAYNEGRVIDASLRSLLQLDYPHYEILVVDDGSTDETSLRARALAGEHGRARVRVVTKRNSGKAGALNAGIRAARTGFVLCMDGDTKLAPASLRRAMRHFADASVGAVAGNVKVLNRNALLTRLQALEYVQGLNMARRAQGFFRAVAIVPGPLGVFRRSALLEVGGYPTDTFAEDCDLTLAILGRGWKIHYDPDARAWTEAPESILDLVKQRYRWTRGVLQALRKHARAPRRRQDAGLAAAVAQLGFEVLVWPGVNVLAHLFFVYASVRHGIPAILLVWWLQLTLLDVVAAFYCLAAEEEDLRLLGYALVYRVAFTLIMDVCKLLSTMDELLAIDMDWGKLERVGRA